MEQTSIQWDRRQQADVYRFSGDRGKVESRVGVWDAVVPTDQVASTTRYTRESLYHFAVLDWSNGSEVAHTWWWNRSLRATRLLLLLGCHRYGRSSISTPLFELSVEAQTSFEAASFRFEVISEGYKCLYGSPFIALAAEHVVRATVQMWSEGSLNRNRSFGTLSLLGYTIHDLGRQSKAHPALIVVKYLRRPRF